MAAQPFFVPAALFVAIWLIHLVAFAAPLAGAFVATSHKSWTFRVEK